MKDIFPFSQFEKYVYYTVVFIFDFSLMTLQDFLFLCIS